MEWIVVAVILLIAFQAGQFIGFFRGWKFGLLHPPKTIVYFTPMLSIRLREWGLQVRLTNKKVFRIGAVTESKDSAWASSQTETFYPNRGSDGYPFGWLEALSDSMAEVFIREEDESPWTMKLAEAVGLVTYGGLRTKEASEDFVWAWDNKKANGWSNARAYQEWQRQFPERAKALKDPYKSFKHGMETQEKNSREETGGIYGRKREESRRGKN